MQTQFEALVQSNLPELLKTQFLVPLITAFLGKIGENLCLEFELVHKVLKISKKLATFLQFGTTFLQLRAVVIAVSSANGTFCLLFPGCGVR